MRLTFLLAYLGVEVYLFLQRRQQHQQTIHILMTHQQAFNQIVSDTTQLRKAQGEIRSKLDSLLAKIEDLKNNGELSEADQQAVNELHTLAQQLDDLVPDAPVNPETVVSNGGAATEIDEHADALKAATEKQAALDKEAEGKAAADAETARRAALTQEERDEEDAAKGNG